MTKTLRERINTLLDDYDYESEEAGLPLTPFGMAIEIIKEQISCITELEAEPTEEEVEKAACEIWIFAQQLDDIDDIRLDPTRDDCIGMAKAALEAARKVRITKE